VKYLEDKKHFIIIGGILLLSLVAFFVFISKDKSRTEIVKEPEIQSPWKPTSHAFDPNRCNDGKCDEMIRLPMIGTTGLSIMVDPKIDGEVAQWSDCLASITQCVDNKDAFEVNGFHECVNQSGCPARCKDGFNHQTQHAQNMKEMMAAFDAYFIEDGGTCTPR